MEKVDLLFSGYGKFQACSQDFLHFECFEELGIISPNFNLQSNFLQIDYYFYSCLE